MELQTFFDNFEVMAEAPNGIDELRELIFRLALSGKVVPQEASEGSGEDLRSSLAKERTELETKGQLKKRKSLGDPKPSDRLFEIPSSWDWAYLNEVGDWGSGSTPSRSKSEYYSDEGMPWLKSGELNDSYVNEAEEFVTKKALAECSLRINKPGDVLMAMYGATVGKLAILEFEATTNQAVCACSCFPGVYNRYLFLSLRGFRRVFIGQGAGGAQPNISRVKIVSTAIPLPPLEEQKRIVAKVDQLMALCDELEEKKEKRNKYRVRANEASLDKLLNAQEPEEFEEHWQRVVENFDSVIESVDDIERVRDSLLYLGIAGRLVPSFGTVQDGKSLAREIKRLKDALIESGEVKVAARSKASAKHDPNPIAYPPGWTLQPLEQVTELITDGTHQTPKYVASGRMFISAKNVKPFKFMPDVHKYVSEEAFQEYLKNRKPQFGDILLTRVGAGIGEAAVIDRELEFAIYVSVGLIRPLRQFLDPDFLCIWLNSPAGRRYSSRNTLGKGVSQGNLNLSLIRGFQVGVPPIDEQRMIVERVNQLREICSALENKIRIKEQYSRNYSVVVSDSMVS